MMMMEMMVDYSDDYIKMITSNTDNSPKYKSMLELCSNARSYCKQWTTETAEMSTMITNDDQSSNSIGSFYTMLSVWLLITWLPLIFIGFNGYTYYTKYILDNPIKPPPNPYPTSVVGIPAQVPMSYPPNKQSSPYRLH